MCVCVIILDYTSYDTFESAEKINDFKWIERSQSTVRLVNCAISDSTPFYQICAAVTVDIDTIAGTISFCYGAYSGCIEQISSTKYSKVGIRI